MEDRSIENCKMSFVEYNTVLHNAELLTKTDISGIKIIITVSDHMI